MALNRERMLSRALPTARMLLPVDHAGAEAAELRIGQARAALQLAMLNGHDAAQLDALQARVEEAEADLVACCEVIVCTALPPEEYEALIGKHPAREGKDEDWNGDTLPREAFLLCAPTELSTAEWEEFLATRVNDSERAMLFETAVAANIRFIGSAVPKG